MYWQQTSMVEPSTDVSMHRFIIPTLFRVSGPPWIPQATLSSRTFDWLMQTPLLQVFCGHAQSYVILHGGKPGDLACALAFGYAFSAVATGCPSSSTPIILAAAILSAREIHAMHVINLKEWSFKISWWFLTENFHPPFSNVFSIELYSPWNHELAWNFYAGLSGLRLTVTLLPG